jgi:hypothetical protein
LPRGDIDHTLELVELPRSIFLEGSSLPDQTRGTKAAATAGESEHSCQKRDPSQ